MIAANKPKAKARNFSKKDKINYWKMWHKSGLSKRKFCINHKLPSSFYSWGKFLEIPPNQDKQDGITHNSGNNSNLSLLLPVNPLNESSEAPDNNIQCVYSNNNGIQLNLSISVPNLIQLIVGVEHATTVIR